MKNTLENTVCSFVEAAFPGAFEPSSSLLFQVRAFELWRDGEGWSCNDSWRLEKEVTAEMVLEAARGRWGVFKANYSSRARVKDIKDVGYDTTIHLEVEGLPFLEICPA